MLWRKGIRVPSIISFLYCDSSSHFTVRFVSVAFSCSKGFTHFYFFFLVGFTFLLEGFWWDIWRFSVIPELFWLLLRIRWCFRVLLKPRSHWWRVWIGMKKRYWCGTVVVSSWLNLGQLSRLYKVAGHSDVLNWQLSWYQALASGSRDLWPSRPISRLRDRRYLWSILEIVGSKILHSHFEDRVIDDPRTKFRRLEDRWSSRSLWRPWAYGPRDKLLVIAVEWICPATPFLCSRFLIRDYDMIVTF